MTIPARHGSGLGISESSVNHNLRGYTRDVFLAFYSIHIDENQKIPAS